MGTSGSSIIGDKNVRDHPHAYGDKNIVKVAVTVTVGSSPRVWGQVALVEVWYRNTRIIPTRMGTRRVVYIGKLIGKDHPHAYGDKFSAYYISALLVGSSPRVWGQVKQISAILNTSRIIPTRMGTRSNL